MSTDAETDSLTHHPPSAEHHSGKRIVRRHVRQGWAQSSRALAAAVDDKLMWPEFANDEDRELTW
jgi:hypothetical protein